MEICPGEPVWKNSGSIWEIYGTDMLRERDIVKPVTASGTERNGRLTGRITWWGKYEENSQEVTSRTAAPVWVSEIRKKWSERNVEMFEKFPFRRWTWQDVCVCVWLSICTIRGVSFTLVGFNLSCVYMHLYYMFLFVYVCVFMCMYSCMYVCMFVCYAYVSTCVQKQSSTTLITFSTLGYLPRDAYLQMSSVTHKQHVSHPNFILWQNIGFSLTWVKCGGTGSVEEREVWWNGKCGPVPSIVLHTGKGGIVNT